MLVTAARLVMSAGRVLHASSLPLLLAARLLSAPRVRKALELLQLVQLLLLRDVLRGHVALLAPVLQHVLLGHLLLGHVLLLLLLLRRL